MVDSIIAIPARSGSKGLPGKNIKSLCGKPLIAYTIELALKADLGRVIVSTDSEKYADIAISYGAEAPFLRPKEISQDTSLDIEWLKHMMANIDAPEYIISLQPNQPLREIKYIKMALDMLRADPDATGVTSLGPPTRAWASKVIKGKYLADYKTGSFEMNNWVCGRQVAPKTYEQNGYLSVFKRSVIEETGGIWGNKVIGIVTPDITDIDTQDDFDYVEYQLKQRNNNVQFRGQPHLAYM